MTVGLLGAAGAALAESSPDRAAAGQLVALVNHERAAAGLAPLGVSDVAIEFAEAWSLDMARTGVLAHNDAWFGAEAKTRAGAKASAENVAYNGDVADAHRRLMESPGHRANILDARFHQIGIGAVQDGDGKWWITEDFVQLRVVSDAEDSTPGSPPPEQPAPPAPPSDPAVTPPTSGGGGAQELSTTAGEPRRPLGRTVEAEGRRLVDGIDAESGGAWPRAVRDVAEVAGGQRLLAPALERGAAMPGGLAALAAVVLAADVAVLVRRRRRRRQPRMPS